MSRQLEPYQQIERSIQKTYHKRLWTPFITAIKQYDLIAPGDRIAVCISGGVQALMALWDFDDFVFFEHFAVDPACRNGGIGGQMLDALLARYDKPACLEAELPETELAARRIGFYERHGFTVNADYSYFQPALAPGGSPIPLYLLTTGGARTPSELRAMETLVHTRVYGQTSAAAGK